MSLICELEKHPFKVPKTNLNCAKYFLKVTIK